MILGVSSPFFSAIVLFKNQQFRRVFGGFLERFGFVRMDMEVTPRVIAYKKHPTSLRRAAEGTGSHWARFLFTTTQTPVASKQKDPFPQGSNRAPASQYLALHLAKSQICVLTMDSFTWFLSVPAKPPLENPFSFSFS